MLFRLAAIGSFIALATRAALVEKPRTPPTMRPNRQRFAPRARETRSCAPHVDISRPGMYIAGNGTVFRLPVRSIHRRRQNLELFSIPIASKVSAETDTNLKFVYLSVTLNNHTCLFNFSASSCESRSSWPSGIYSQGMTRCGPTLLKTLAV